MNVAAAINQPQSTNCTFHREIAFEFHRFVAITHWTDKIERKLRYELHPDADDEHFDVGGYEDYLDRHRGMQRIPASYRNPSDPLRRDFVIDHGVRSGVKCTPCFDVWAAEMKSQTEVMCKMANNNQTLAMAQYEMKMKHKPRRLRKNYHWWPKNDPKAASDELGRFLELFNINLSEQWHEEEKYDVAAEFYCVDDLEAFCDTKTEGESRNIVMQPMGVLLFHKREIWRKERRRWQAIYKLRRERETKMRNCWRTTATFIRNARELKIGEVKINGRKYGTSIALRNDSDSEEEDSRKRKRSTSVPPINKWKEIKRRRIEVEREGTPGNAEEEEDSDDYNEIETDDEDME